jgi:hypothetical protein
MCDPGGERTDHGRSLIEHDPSSRQHLDLGIEGKNYGQWSATSEGLVQCLQQNLYKSLPGQYITYGTNAHS